MSISVKVDLQERLREGYLQKRSRYLHEWRKRYFILTPTQLQTFKSEFDLNHPTEAVPLKQCSTVKTCDDEVKRNYSFKLDTYDISYQISTTSNQEKEGWIGAIGKAMVPTVVKSKYFYEEEDLPAVIKRK